MDITANRVANLIARSVVDHVAVDRVEQSRGNHDGSRFATMAIEIAGTWFTIKIEENI